MSKYNWDKIKSEYIEGVKNEKGDIRYPTLKELSEKYGCSYLYIRGVSSKNNWTQEHNIYLTKITQLRQDKKSEVLASEASQFDSKTLELAKAGEKFIDLIFSQLNEEYKNVGFIKKSIEGLDKALVNYQRAGKLALGESIEKKDIVVQELIDIDISKYPEQK